MINVEGTLLYIIVWTLSGRYHATHTLNLFQSHFMTQHNQKFVWIIPKILIEIKFYIYNRK